MLDPVYLPDCLQFLRLFGTFAITIVFGIHAYDRHARESVEVVSRTKWMYWLYAMVFLIAGTANFVQFYVTVAFHSYRSASLHLGYLTLLLVLSYVALLVGVCRKSYQ